MSTTFTDFKNYPHGFRRSGHFSIKDSDRIEKYGTQFQQWLSGASKPSSAEENAIYNQLTGQAETTAPEVLAWQKYQAKISESKQYFPLCSTPTDLDDVVAKKSSGGGDDDSDSSDADDISVDEVDPMEDDGDDLEIDEA